MKSTNLLRPYKLYKLGIPIDSYYQKIIEFLEKKFGSMVKYENLIKMKGDEFKKETFYFGKSCCYFI